MSSKPSIILMGSKPGSVVALSLLLEHGWDVRHVVVSREIAHPWIQGPTLAEEAQRRGLSVVTQKELPRNEQVDFVISYMYRYLVRPDVLRLGGRASLNFHAGPLPEFGGWAFYNVAILENAPEYGCTCHYMDEGFDTGPLLKVSRFPIDASKETAWSLERKAQGQMIRLFAEFVEMAEAGAPLPEEEQDPSRHRYMTREEFEQLKEIPADADAKTVERYARAFWYPPYQGAHVKLRDAKVEVIPSIVKEEVASLLHHDSLDYLKSVLRITMPEKAA